MRAFLILLAIVLLLSLIGWVSFSRGPGRSSINVETDQIRTDADRALQSGADLLHKAGDDLKQATAPQDEQTPPAQPRTAPVSK